jgi:GxGYxYP putative glycoside hydrolase C-terminal domain/GxGYxYP third domain/GxGYxYP_N second domain/GxGYxYP_N 1st domain
MNLRTKEMDWSSNSVWPTFQAPDHLDVYDIRGASQDVQLSVTTMTGVINHQQPKVYLLSSDDAAFWLNEAFAQVPHVVSPATGNDALEALLISYGSSIQGLIIYDPNCLDSINIATMLAGQRDGMVVSPAQADALQGPPHQLPVVADLRIYQWKNRIQAYTWAEGNLLNSAAPNLVAGLDPKISGALRSFLVATRTFIYWLDARKNLPDVLNGWISERGLMQRIFSAFPAGSFHLGWFVDEPQGVSLTSKAAMPVLASDFCENLEVWTSVQHTQGVKQEQAVIDVKSVDAGIPRAYVSFTISDGDNLQYDQHRMARLWQDPARSTMPIGWTISPALVQVAPSLAAYYMNTASSNDELIAGPSGAGYMFPSDWPQEQLPGFLQFTGELMQAMKLSVIEVLDTGSGQAFINQRLQAEYVNVLAPLGVQGILSGSGQTQSSWSIVSGVPVLQNLGLGGSVNKTVNLVKNASARYLNVYIMAWSMTPSDLKQVVQQLGNQYEVVTPGRLLEMIASSF